jgi:hypothetical protein
MKIDTKNEDPRYWEEVLSRHALSEKQLGMDIPDVQASEEGYESDEEVEQVDEFLFSPKRETARPVSNANPDFEILRTKVDSKDRFMEGHQIKKIRGRVRENPDWAYDNKVVQALIDGAKGLNKWRTNPRQRVRAARWAGVIHYYYRMGLSRSVVAKELGVPEKVVNGILKRINRIMKGKDSGNRGGRKRPLPLPLC